MPEEKTDTYATTIFCDPRYHLDTPKIFPPDLKKLVDLEAMNFIWNRYARIIPCKDGSYIDLNGNSSPNADLCLVADDDQINNENGHSIYWRKLLQEWHEEEYWTTTVSLIKDTEEIASVNIEVFISEGIIDIIFEDPIDGSLYDTLDEALQRVLQAPNAEYWDFLQHKINNDTTFDAKIQSRRNIEYYVEKKA